MPTIKDPEAYAPVIIDPENTPEEEIEALESWFDTFWEWFGEVDIPEIPKPLGRTIDLFHNTRDDMEDSDFYWEGVYLIGYHYIGRSKNIEERLKQHWNSVFHPQDLGAKEAIERWLVYQPGLKIPVTILSFDQDEEREMIRNYYQAGFPLTNRYLLPRCNC